MSWSNVIWLVVAIVGGWWVLKSGFIQNFAMGVGGAQAQSRMPKGRMRRG